jgi:hypothetical protein
MGMIFRFVFLLTFFSLFIQKSSAQITFDSTHNSLQKKLMVQLKAPGFLRAGDHLEIPVVITNTTDSELTGQVQFQLFDPETHQPVDGWFSNRQSNQYFTAAARQGTTISFPIDIPYEYNRLLNLRIETEINGSEKVSRDRGSNGQERILPVLPNRILITESLPINMLQGGTKDFHFDALLKKGNNESISQHAFKIEFTSNPVWYAIESLPYLLESSSEFTEQVFDRFYANALGIAIQNHSSEIEDILESWKGENPIQSYNNDLRPVLREEMPWVLAPKNEMQQRQYLSGLLDVSRLKNECKAELNNLESLQSATGGFSWYKGEPEDRFLTQYILIRLGRLKKMGSIDPDYIVRLNRLAAKSIDWADQKIKEDLISELKKNAHPGQIPLSPIQIQWLFAHSYFPEIVQSAQVSNVSAYISNKAEAAWPALNKMLQAMISIWLYRIGKQEKAAEILASFKKNAVHAEELGIYWNNLKPGSEWYQSLPETISILIEAFSEINPDIQFMNGLKTWLIRQKESTHWITKRATADACYALISQQESFLKTEPRLRIQLGKKELPLQSDKIQGPGFYSNSIFPPFIKAEMGDIRLTLAPATGEKKLSPGWGAAYWQYFDGYDRSNTNIGQAGIMFIKKSILLKKNGGQTVQLVPINEKGTVRLGDKLSVRIELTIGKDLEFVQLKDNWASCLQPIDTLSGFKKKGSLRYFEKSGVGSNLFFFARLKKGKYLFEYDLDVQILGTFSCGSAIAECMYTPHVSASTQPMKINVIEQ